MNYKCELKLVLFFTITYTTDLDKPNIAIEYLKMQLFVGAALKTVLMFCYKGCSL